MIPKHFFALITCLITTSFAVAQMIAKTPHDITPLLIGHEIPAAQIQNAQGDNVDTKTVLSQPTVLVFYRGGWCPFCNAHLSELQNITHDIENLGYKIVAVSPDSRANEMTTDEKLKLSYELYSDSDLDFIKAMGIAFEAPAKYANLLTKSSAGMNDQGVLPVPALFVVNKGKVVFSYVNPDYSTRIKGPLLLSVLKHL